MIENQRVRLSKRLLKEALLDLLQEKDIQKITVYEICARAEINRTTFYKYFASPYDLLKSIETDVLTELERRLKAKYDPSGGALVKTLSYLEEDRKKCLTLINSEADKEFAVKLFGSPVIQTIADEFIAEGYTPAQADYIQTFLCYGGYALIRKWLNQPVREPPEEIAELFLSFANCILNNK